MKTTSSAACPRRSAAAGRGCRELRWPGRCPGPEHRRGDVVGRDRKSGRIGAEAVARPVDRARRDSAAGHEDGVAIRPVIAAVGAELLRVLDLRRPAEFTHPDDQSLVQQPRRFEVLDQGGHGLVGDRQQPVLELVEIVAVRVPAAVALAADRRGIIDRYEPNAGLDQPARQQAALAVARSPVLVAQPIGLFGEVERALDLGRAEHGACARV